MAKVQFTVDDGIRPGDSADDVGHTGGKFRDVHVSRNIQVDAGGSITIGGSAVGGVDTTSAIAYAIALG